MTDAGRLLRQQRCGAGDVWSGLRGPADEEVAQLAIALVRANDPRAGRREVELLPAELTTREVADVRLARHGRVAFRDVVAPPPVGEGRVATRLPFAGPARGAHRDDRRIRAREAHPLFSVIAGGHHDDDAGGDGGVD